MSNYLVLTSEYIGVVGASGVCTRNIVQELKKRGNYVDVLCYESSIKEENTYTISIKRNHWKIFKLLNFIRSFFFPIINKSVENLFIEKSIYICKYKNIDKVICIYFPLESMGVFKSIKERYPSIEVISYELDSVGDGIYASSKIHVISKKIYEFWMNYNYQFADKIIIMRSHVEYWKRIFGEHVQKLLVADIPVLENNIKNSIYKEKEIHVLYAGLLGKKYRSPSKMLKVFDKLSRRMKIVFDIYSRGDCEEIIFNVAKNNSNIQQHGYVAKEIIDEALSLADILVSIGNNTSKSIPSKLINYFSYGKPVVHFAANREDVCIEYIHKYPLGIVVYETESIDENVEKLLHFWEEIKNKRISFCDISKEFYMNEPRYSVDLINNNRTDMNCNKG